MDVYGQRGFEAFLEELEAAIRDARDDFGIRIFNMSLNLRSPVEQNQYSVYAARLDEIQNRLALSSSIPRATLISLTGARRGHRSRGSTCSAGRTNWPGHDLHAVRKCSRLGSRRLDATRLHARRWDAGDLHATRARASCRS